MKLLWSISVLISYHTNMWARYEDYSFHVQKEKSKDPYILTVFKNKEVIAKTEHPCVKTTIMHINYNYSEEYK